MSKDSHSIGRLNCAGIAVLVCRCPLLHRQQCCLTCMREINMHGTQSWMCLLDTVQGLAAAPARLQLRQRLRKTAMTMISCSCQTATATAKTTCRSSANSLQLLLQMGRRTACTRQAALLQPVMPLRCQRLWLRDQQFQQQQQQQQQRQRAVRKGRRRGNGRTMRRMPRLRSGKRCPWQA